jgi:hypothetical protein
VLLHLWALLFTYATLQNFEEANSFEENAKCGLVGVVKAHARFDTGHGTRHDTWNGTRNGSGTLNGSRTRTGTGSRPRSIAGTGTGSRTGTLTRMGTGSINGGGYLVSN